MAPMKFKKHNLTILIILISVSFFFSSCKVMYPNRMFKQGNYEYFSVGRETLDQYTIEKGDLLSLRIYSREGFDLIDVLPNETGGGVSGGGNIAQANNANNQQTYLVEEDGFVELPLFGRTYVIGQTENELEDYIEERCRAIFNEPFAVLKVNNRRAFLFKGSTANVVSLNEGPTSLLEVIAKSGGIGGNLKAYKIKILRGDLRNPEIFTVDLSTIEGLRNGELIIQSNDVIYIEERVRYINGVLREITPVLSLIATTSTVVALIKTR